MSEPLSPATPDREFRLQADCTFFATDIDDAMTRLATHFQHVRDGAESECLASGSIRVGLYSDPRWAEVR